MPEIEWTKFVLKDLDSTIPLGVHSFIKKDRVLKCTYISVIFPCQLLRIILFVLKALDSTFPLGLGIFITKDKVCKCTCINVIYANYWEESRK